MADETVSQFEPGRNPGIHPPFRDEARRPGVSQKKTADDSSAVFVGTVRSGILLFLALGFLATLLGDDLGGFGGDDEFVAFLFANALDLNVLDLLADVSVKVFGNIVVGQVIVDLLALAGDLHDVLALVTFLEATFGAHALAFDGDGLATGGGGLIRGDERDGGRNEDEGDDFLHECAWYVSASRRQATTGACSMRELQVIGNHGWPGHLSNIAGSRSPIDPLPGTRGRRILAG